MLMPIKNFQRSAVAGNFIEVYPPYWQTKNSIGVSGKQKNYGDLCITQPKNHQSDKITPI